MPDVIGFWKPAKPYGWLSQWYDSPFVIAGIEYKCCEQYMMAKKAEFFGDIKVQRQIMKTPHPNDMKRLGKMVKNFDQERWEERMIEVAYEGNTAKFSQNPDLGKRLIDTGDAILAEASPFDKIWGIGIGVEHKNFLKPERWKGRNVLGETLMTVREELGMIRKK